MNFESDEYTCSIAKTPDEAAELVKAGFEYVYTTPQDLLLCRKRK